jgi:tetratricopeptide (TPR) repeat protein
MPLIASLVNCCLKPLVEGASAALGYALPSAGADAVGGFLRQRFTDHSQRLSTALTHANQHAWHTLELALAGDSAWEQCQQLLATTERQAFRTAIRDLLAPAPDTGASFRRSCWEELRHARSVGLLDATTQPDALLAAADPLLRFHSPTDLITVEQQLLADVARRLDDAGCVNLAKLIVVGAPPVVVTAVRYFFRRAVEQDSALAQGLTFAQLEKLQTTQEQGFAALHGLLTQQQAALDRVLADLQTALFDLRTEQQQQGATQRALYDEVLRVGERLERILERPMRRSDSLSIRTEGERTLVRQVVERYRALPPGQQLQLPALLNAIGRLELAVGDCAAAQTDFQAVARIVNHHPAQALAHFQAYLAALEQRNYPVALAELVEALRLDGRKYAPFPVGRYHPERILGAGGFGVAFLCKHKQLGSTVVVKALFTDDLDRDFDDVFREARALDELDHPNIIRLKDCDYTLPAQRERPYLVMPYFDGQTLDAQVRLHGPLSVPATLAVARQMAAGLQAAHTQGILHRDVKPANVLVRPPVGSLSVTGGPAVDWSVKLIDFGLALTRRVLSEATQSTVPPLPTATGASIAGTLDYAAPEQLGRLPGEKVRARADIYGWAKTVCYALFQTPTPRRHHWAQVPDRLADLLDRCLAEKPSDRPASFAAVLAELEIAPTTAAPPPTAAPPSPPVVPTSAPPAPSPLDEAMRLELVNAELRTLRKLLDRPVELHKLRPVTILLPTFFGIGGSVAVCVPLALNKVIHPLATVPIVAAFLGVAVLGAFLALRWLNYELRLADLAIAHRIAALETSCGGLVREWGGTRALSSPDVVKRLIEHLDDEIARKKGGTPPSKSWLQRVQKWFENP